MSNRKLNILLIDDDEDDYVIVRKLLAQVQGRKYRLDWVSTYEAGLDALAKNGYDVYLVDYQLGAHDGLEVLREAGRRGCSSPMILLTGQGGRKVDVEAMKAGAADYLVKGNIDAELLERSIRYAVERAKTNRKLKQTQAHLIQWEKIASLGHMAAGIAHEINNPVSFVMGNLQTLSEYVQVVEQLMQACKDLSEATTAGDEARQREIADVIRAICREENLSYILSDVKDLVYESTGGIKRVKDIVQGLKSFARTDGCELEDADINAGIEDALKIVWNEIKYKCKVNKELGDLPTVRCCPGQLNQVFVNLLVNAAQAILEHGEITICTEETEKHVVVRIADTGKGIPAAVRHRIFEPFFTTKTGGEGTGLGLAISYSIVHAHKGTIDVRSVEGEGTEFTVHIPKNLEGELISNGETILSDKSTE